MKTIITTLKLLALCFSFTSFSFAGEGSTGGGTGVALAGNTVNVFFDLYNADQSFIDRLDISADTINNSEIIFDVRQTEAYQRLCDRFDLWSVQSELLGAYFEAVRNSIESSALTWMKMNNSFQLEGDHVWANGKSPLTKIELKGVAVYNYAFAAALLSVPNYQKLGKISRSSAIYHEGLRFDSSKLSTADIQYIVSTVMLKEPLSAEVKELETTLRSLRQIPNLVSRSLESYVKGQVIKFKNTLPEEFDDDLAAIENRIAVNYTQYDPLLNDLFSLIIHLAQYRAVTYDSSERSVVNGVIKNVAELWRLVDDSRAGDDAIRANSIKAGMGLIKI